MKTSLKTLCALTAIVIGGAGINMAVAQDAAKTATPPAPLDSKMVMDQESVGQLGIVSDADIEGLEVSSVQPVVFLDAKDSNEAATTLAGVASLTADDAEAKILEGNFSSVTIPATTDTKSEEGLGFGGNSRKLDIYSVKYGYMLGALPLVRAVAKSKYDGVYSNVKKLSVLNKYYSTNTQTLLKRYTDNAAKGAFNGKDYANLLAATTKAMAQASSTDKQRIHGYLLVGLWSGYAKMLASAGRGSTGMSQVGESLRTMLLKDARYGGSDVALAGHVKLIAAAIKNKPNKGSVNKAVSSILAVKSDK